jgi:hypothetical protein
MDTTWYAYPLWIAAAVEVQLAVVSCHLLQRGSQC